MLSFHQLDQKITEAGDMNPAPAHSNNTKNRHVIDYGSHLDGKLKDKMKSVSMRPDGMERGTGEVSPIRDTLGQVSRMPDGEVARVIYNIVTKNPNKYPIGQAIPLDQLVNILHSDSYRDQKGEYSLRSYDNAKILQGIHILAKKVNVPLFDVIKGADNKFSISIKSFKADPNKVQTPSPETKKMALNPDEDQLAKPGAGGRYKTIQPNMKPTDKSAADIQIGRQMQQAKSNFDKVHGIASVTGANAAMNQAAKGYQQALQQAISTPGVSQELQQQAQAELQRIQQTSQEFVKQWPEASPSIPMA